MRQITRRNLLRSVGAISATLPFAAAQPQRKTRNVMLIMTDRARNIMPMVPSSSRFTKHNAHGPEVVKIHYPFHPLHGQSLRVERRAKLPKGEYIFCELPDGTIGGFPSWIADPTKSSNFTVGPAMTSAAALAELRKLLDSLHSNSQRGNASLKEMRREDTNDYQEKHRRRHR